MKNKIKLIPLMCSTIISIVGFNALNFSQAFQKLGYQPTSIPRNSAPINDWHLKGTRDIHMGMKIATHTWSGNWRCRQNENGKFSTLTIHGNGADSSIAGYYPKAHGGQPASETYSIYNIDYYSATGVYEYRDANPRIGSTGQRGLWTGNWRIDLQGTVVNPVLRLFREDHASGWRGTYVCNR